MEIKFSVIIPTYKRNEFLKRAIEKTIIQKKKPIEIIIVDDNCDKETETIVNNYKNNTHNINIIYLNNKKNIGALHSRNKGAKVSIGNYLAFLDDDDFWNDEYLDNIEKKIHSFGFDFCLSDFYKFKDVNNFYSNNLIPEKFNIEDYLFSNPGAICSNVVIKKSIFDLLKGFDVKISGSADKDLFIRANLEKYKCIVLRQKNMFYQIHENQWSKDNKLILNQKFVFFLKYFKYYLSVYKLYRITKIFISFTFRAIKDTFLKDKK